MVDNSNSVQEKFLKYVGQTSPFDPSLEVASAQGMFITDTAGRRYLDFISGFSVTNLGHCHPQVTRAVLEQAQKYAHTSVYGEHVQAPQVELAEAIAKVAPPPLNCVYFLCSGAEANDAALKLAAKTTGRSRFVAFTNAYHGTTVGAMSCFGSEHFRKQFSGLQAQTVFLPFGDTTLLTEIDESVAAVIMEPVQGEAGIIPPPPGFLEAVRRRCSDVGALLIFDEVQTGFGRTGQWFAAHTYGITPDVITMAKGMGAGYPLAGVLADREMLFNFAADPPFSHITTFGGHPVSCAAGLASMRVIAEENLLDNAREQGEYLLENLHQMKTRHGDLIADVRGTGLMIGLDMATEPLARYVVETARKNGLILETSLLRGTNIRLTPALIVSRNECDIALGIIDEAIASGADIL